MHGLAGITHTYTAALSEEGYVVRALTPGMILDDTLVLKLKIRVTMVRRLP